MGLPENHSFLIRRLFPAAAPLCLVLGAALAPASRASLSEAAAFPSVDSKMGFRRDIRSLLQGSFADFMEAMEAADSSGRTFWHRIAEKKDLAEELETLLQALSVPDDGESMPRLYSLGGLEIGMSRLEREPVARAAMAGDIPSFLAEARQLAETASAAEVLSLLQGTEGPPPAEGLSSGAASSDSGQRRKNLYGLLLDGLEKSYGDSEGYEIHRQILENSMLEIRDYLRALVRQKDKNGLKPADLAKKHGNKRGRRALRKSFAAETLDSAVSDAPEEALEDDVLDMSLRDILTNKLKALELAGAAAGFGLAAWIVGFNPITDSWLGTMWKTPIVLWAARKGQMMVRKKYDAGRNQAEQEAARRGQLAARRKCQSAFRKEPDQGD